MAHASDYMKSIAVEGAVGTILCHDITQIIPGKSKGPIFCKGHVVRKEDIPVLLSVGKEHLYVYDPIAGILHENDAAERIVSSIAGENIRKSLPKEGRINLYATCHGLLEINVSMLDQINQLGEISVATLHTLQEVEKNQAVAGTRITPLVIEEEKIVALERLVVQPVIRVLPLKPCKVGVIITGNEVYHGRIEDGFGAVLEEKAMKWGCSIIAKVVTNDEASMTTLAIKNLISQGAQMVWVSGGMSVDPDDRTPLAIRNTGADILSYGAPTFPGAMFLLSYLATIPVLGLPGCVMYHKASVFDIIVPRLLAGVPVTKDSIAMLGHGGFCSSCLECSYPICPFGKG